jgi:hypothetical protein
VPDIITIIAVLLVAHGVLQTFTKELWWAWIRYHYGMVGLTATRTAAWNRWTTWSGVIWLLAGVAVYVVVPR